MNNIYKANRNVVNNKSSFKNIKNNTFKSLNEVGCFWYNINYFYRYLKLYKLLK